MEFPPKLIPLLHIFLYKIVATCEEQICFSVSYFASTT